MKAWRGAGWQLWHLTQRLSSLQSLQLGHFSFTAFKLDLKWNHSWARYRDLRQGFLSKTRKGFLSKQDNIFIGRALCHIAGTSMGYFWHNSQATVGEAGLFFLVCLKCIFSSCHLYISKFCLYLKSVSDVNGEWQNSAAASMGRTSHIIWMIDCCGIWQI